MIAIVDKTCTKHSDKHFLLLPSVTVRNVLLRACEHFNIREIIIMCHRKNISTVGLYQPLQTCDGIYDNKYM